MQSELQRAEEYLHETDHQYTMHICLSRIEKNMTLHTNTTHTRTHTHTKESADDVSVQIY